MWLLQKKIVETKEGRLAKHENISGIEIPLSKNIHGRILAKDLKR